MKLELVLEQDMENIPWGLPVRFTEVERAGHGFIMGVAHMQRSAVEELGNPKRIKITIEPGSGNPTYGDLGQWQEKNLSMRFFLC